jgi:integrase
MSGSIKKLSDGVFELRWDLPKDPQSNKRRTKSKRFHGGIRQAQKELARIVAETDDETARSSDASFETVANEWLTLKKSQLKYSTWVEYERRLNSTIIPSLGAIPLSKLTTRDLDRYYHAMYAENPQKDLSHSHAIIRNIFAQCIKWGYVHDNPALRVTLPKRGSTPVQVASVEKLGAILEATDNETWARLFAFAALTGMRRGELCALRWTDVDGETLIVSRSIIKRKGEVVEGSTKTHQVRRVHLDPSAQKILLDHFNFYLAEAQKAGVAARPDGYLWFAFPTGEEAIHPDSITKAFKKYAIKAGAPDLHFHSLRHFSATQLIAAGVDVRTVASRLGHADPSITLRVYSHALSENDQRAASILGSIVSGASQK